MRGPCLTASLSFFDVDALSRRGCSSADNRHHCRSVSRYKPRKLRNEVSIGGALSRPHLVVRPALKILALLFIYFSLSLCMFNHDLCYPFRPPNDSCLPELTARFTLQNTPADWIGTLKGPLRRRYFRIVLSLNLTSPLHSRPSSKLYAAREARKNSAYFGVGLTTHYSTPPPIPPVRRL